jgi:hypothetical protein
MLQVPALSRLRVVPLALQTSGVVELNVTCRPDVEVAINALGTVPKDWLPGDTKVMACGATVTAKEFTTGAALANAALPAWLAVTVQVPTPIRLKAALATVQTVGVLDANATVRPEVEAATSGSGAVLKT